MSSKRQLMFFKYRRRKYHCSRNKALAGCPQKKGVCLKLRLVKPKKPNSAIRKIVKLRLSTNVLTLAYIPGQGHNLHEHSRVLIRGGRIPDLPGINYKLIRGKFDFAWKEKIIRVHSRSKYGVPSEKKGKSSESKNN